MPLRLNISCIAKLSELIRKIIGSFKPTKDDISSKTDKKEISAPLNKTTSKVVQRVSFRNQRQWEINAVIASDKVRVDHLVRFAKNSFLNLFKEIDEAFPEAFYELFESQ